MAEFVVCAPMGVEWAAAKAGFRGTDVCVVRLGMGPSKVTRNRARFAGSGPVSVVGVAGGLAAGVSCGDVVVASELWVEGAEPVLCPTAPLLANSLRRLGLTVHVGPIVSTPRVVTGAARTALTAGGALAVDMESGYVAALAGDRPLAVVRVIVDTEAEPIVRPSIVVRGARALATVRRLAPALIEWAAAASVSGVVMAAPRSFCAGVERAIEIVDRALRKFGAPVYVRRHIVHNNHVVAGLESRGAVFVTELDEVPVGANVVLAAHGVSPAVRREAEDRSLAVVDATCPLVAKVHSEVRRYAAADHTVLLIGHADHEEVVGSAGEAPEHVRVIESAEAARAITVEDPTKVAYAVQTTLAVDEATEVVEILRDRFPNMREPRHDDICYATSNRQLAVTAVAASTDLMLVVGSTTSSNSVRLVEVAQRSGVASYLIEDVSEIDLRWFAGVDQVGITAGASAPPHLVDAVVAAISGFGVATREHQALVEDVQFSLPKEVA